MCGYNIQCLSRKAGKTKLFAEAYGGDFYKAYLGVPFDPPDQTVADCVKYAESHGWVQHPARTKLPGPMGHVDFVKQYVGQHWQGHGYSVQSLTCIVSEAVRKNFSVRHPCPKCCFEFCRKYKNILSTQRKKQLKEYFQKGLFI